MREAVRKPYIIYDYMYANTLRVNEMPRLQQQGILSSAKFVRFRAVDPERLVESGRDIYRVQCASCHTVDGYNSIRFAVKGWRQEMIDYQLLHLNELKGFMPPFVGTDAERRALVAWLVSLNPQPATRETPPPGMQAGSPETPQGAPEP